MLRASTNKIYFNLISMIIYLLITLNVIRLITIDTTFLVLYLFGYWSPKHIRLDSAIVCINIQRGVRKMRHTILALRMQWRRPGVIRHSPLFSWPSFPPTHLSSFGRIASCNPKAVVSCPNQTSTPPSLLFTILSLPSSNNIFQPVHLSHLLDERHALSRTETSFSVR